MIKHIRAQGIPGQRGNISPFDKYLVHGLEQPGLRALWNWLREYIVIDIFCLLSENRHLKSWFGQKVSGEIIGTIY